MIIWSCSCGEKQWDGEDSFITSIRSIEYQMTDLPYAYALCNFSVYLKVAQAANDSMWSNNSTIENIRSGSKGKYESKVKSSSQNIFLQLPKVHLKPWKGLFKSTKD